MCLEIGSLYRMLTRMMTLGWIEEHPTPSSPAEGGGGRHEQQRRYYSLTSLGREAVVAEVERLDQVLSLARAKLLVPAE